VTVGKLDSGYAALLETHINRHKNRIQKQFTKNSPVAVGKLDSGSAASPEAWPGLDAAQGAGSRQASSPRGLTGRRPGPGQDCHHHCSSA